MADILTPLLDQASSLRDNKVDIYVPNGSFFGPLGMINVAGLIGCTTGLAKQFGPNFN